MRKLVLAAVLASAATGCVAEESGLITAQWSFKELSTNSSLECPTGFDTTAVYAIPVDSFGERIGQPLIDLYNCQDFRGTSDYPIDLYEVYLEITNDNNTALYAQSTSAIVDLVPNDATFTTTIIDDGGFFRFDWDLVGQVSNQPLSCADVQADGVEIVSTLSGTSQLVSDIFRCEDYFGYTGALLAGSYTVSVAALDANDAAISDAPALTNKVIQAPNKITDLGVIVLPIVGE